MSKRHVFGRRKGVEVAGHDRTFTIEMTKEAIQVRKRNSRKLEKVSFERIVNAGGFAKKIGNTNYIFTLTNKGVEVKQKGFTKMLGYELLANIASEQPLLFPELLKENNGS